MTDHSLPPQSKSRSATPEEMRNILLDEILRFLPDPVFAKDKDGAYVAVNPAFAELVGRSISELISCKAHDLFSETTADKLRKNDLKVIEGGEKSVNEEWVDYPDGRRAFLETVKLPLKLPSGQCVGLLGMSRDLTERFLAAEKNRESESTFRIYFDSSPFGIAVLDEEGRYLDGNPATCRILNRTREELGHCFWGQKQPPDVKAELSTFFSELKHVQDNLKRQVRIFSDDGNECHLELHAFRLNVGRYVIFFEDISKRKKTEQSLWQQQALSRAVNESAHLLLGNHKNFEADVRKTLELIARASDADGAYVWQIERGADGKDQGTQGFVWGDSQSAEKWNFEALFNDHPAYAVLSGLQKNESVNSPVAELNKISQAYLSGIGIVSIIVVPIFIDEKFWGFIGLDDNHRRRRWSKAQEDILRNAGLMIATAVRHQRMLDELTESNIRYRDTIAATGEMLWEVDQNLDFRYLSERFFDFSGFRPETFIGRPLADFMHAEDIKRAEIVLDGLARGITKVIREFEFRGLHRNGFYSWYRATAIAQHDEEGNFRGFRGTTGDIQAEKEAKERLHQTLETLEKTNAELERSTRQAQELAKNAEQASIAKSQFLATMSHEIRTPLNGVIGMSELLIGTRLNQKQREYARLVKESGRSLLSLINDILDFSKIEAGKLEIDHISFNLHEVAESVLGILAERASEKHLELCGVCDPDVPQVVRGDDSRLRQILVNLVGNAVKFTEHGGVRLELSVDRTHPAPDDFKNILFKVIDTGIGIPEDRIHRLFKAFSQVDSSLTRKYGGTGLGLAISSQLVRLMHGEIGIESREGQGSTFWIRLPLEDHSEHATPIPTLRHGDLDLSGRTAVVVDGNPVLRTALLEQLEAWRMNVTAFSSSQEALAALKKAEREGNPFQLLIVDSAPEDNGVELVKKLHANPADKSGETAVVLLVPLTEEIDQAELNEFGSTKLLSKPVYSSPLFNAIVEAIAQQDDEMSEKLEAEKTRTWSLSSTGQRNEFQSETGPAPKILVAEDNRINQIVIKELLAKFGFRFDIVEHGGEAVDTLGRNRYDLILMDCQMPEMDGYEATRRIRALETGERNKLSPGHPKHIPIIALTANVTKGDEEATLAAGMDAYCSKPINADRLFETISAQLKKSEANNDR